MLDLTDVAWLLTTLTAVALIVVGQPRDARRFLLLVAGSLLLLTLLHGVLP